MLISIGVLSRLVPHPANMTAVGGVALFSGAKFGSWKALVVVFFTMLISDAIVGFHAVMWATYGSLALAILVGKWIGSSARVSKLVGGILISSLIFFVITNFAVWAKTPLYPKTLNGLIDCYTMAIPFFRNSIVGDMVYAPLFFGVYELVTTLYRKRRLIFV
jgi:hypothetical protein